MTKFKNKYRIESNRLPNYDFAQPGGYFTTLVTKNRQHYFGEIKNGEMQLNEYGKIADQYWNEIPMHFPNVRLDQYIIMPDHIHGIIFITHKNESSQIPIKSPNNHSVPESGTESIREPGSFPEPKKYSEKFRSPSKTVGSIIRGFKIGVTKWMRNNTDFHDIWQSNYHVHIIRDERHLENIRRYIINNPLKWEIDRSKKKQNIDYCVSH